MKTKITYYFTVLNLLVLLAFTQNAQAQWTTTGTDIHPTTVTNHVLIGTNSISDTEKPLLINSPNLGTGEFGGITLIGANEEIMWRNAGTTDAKAYLRYNGTDVELSSLVDDVEIIATDDIELKTDGSTLAATLDGSRIAVRGRIDLQDASVGNLAIQVRGDEALWYDGDHFSWGFDGNWNRIADEVGIGAIMSEPAFMLDVAGDVNVSGELTADSDVRLKRNIKDLSAGQIIDKLMQLKPVSYDFKNDEYPDLKLAERSKMGFVAQDVQQVFPTLVSEGTKTKSVSGEEFEVLTVNYIELIPVLTKVVQDQQKTIESLQQRLAKLEREENRSVSGSSAGSR